MLRSLAFVLGISTVFIGSSVANAQKTPAELSRLENRSLAEDKELFFPEVSQNRGLDYSDSFVGRLSRERSEFDFLGEDIIIETGDVGADSTYSYIFDNSMTGDRSDETQVLIQVDEW